MTHGDVNVKTKKKAKFVLDEAMKAQGGGSRFIAPLFL